jgi:hypothetical protein
MVVVDHAGVAIMKPRAGYSAPFSLGVVATRRVEVDFSHNPPGGVNDVLREPLVAVGLRMLFCLPVIVPMFDRLNLVPQPDRHPGHFPAVPTISPRRIYY